MEFNNLIAKAICHRNKDFIGFVAALVFVARQLFETIQASLGLSLTPLGILAHPFQFMFDGLGARFLLTLFLFQTFFLLVKPGRIVTLPGNAFTAVKFKNPFGCVIQEVTIVGNGNNRSRETMQELLQPFNAFSVQMVCRFVQQQHIWTRQQQTAQSHTALFTAGQMTNFGFPRRQAKSIRRNFHLRRSIRTGSGNNGFQTGLFCGQCIKVSIWFGICRIHSIKLGLSLHHFAHAFFYGLANRCFRIELRFLRQITNLEIVLPRNFAIDVFIDTGHNLQQRRFTGTIEPQNADLGPREKRQRNIFEDESLGRHHFGHAIHGHDVLSHLS